MTTQLTSVDDGYQIWSERYDRIVEDVFDIQDEISRAIVAKLRVKLASGMRPTLVWRSTENLEAYNLYLKGRHHWNKLTAQGLQKSIEYFQQAIQEDPNYPEPPAELAVAYAHMAVAGFGPPSALMPQAKAEAQKALALSPDLPHGHASLAVVLHFYERDWPGAEREFQRAIELNPGYAEAHSHYAILQAYTGRLDDAVTRAKQALDLDPISLEVNRILSDVLYAARRYDEAVEQARKTLDIEPSYYPAYWYLGLTSVATGRYDEAVATFQQAKAIAKVDPITESGLAWSLALAGRQTEARNILDELEARRTQGYFPALGVAWGYAGLGDSDRTFEWLSTACNERDSLLTNLKVSPWADPLRSDPRFEELLRDLGLAEANTQGQSGTSA